VWPNISVEKSHLQAEERWKLLVDVFQNRESSSEFDELKIKHRSKRQSGI